ncbi:MAG: serine hydrolase [Saprospiraceae bacterium]|nr:serine hydrolase [Saprospiraceae bacterium]
MKKNITIFESSICICSLFLLTSCGVIRSVVFLKPNTNDYRHDPQQKIAPAANIYHFTSANKYQNFGKQISVTSRVDSQKIELEAFAKLYNTEAFMVIRNDTILYESYPNGHTSQSLVSSFSIAKAIMTTLTGIAIFDGDIKNIDQKVSEILPDWEKKGFKNLRIRDLMQHTSGMNFTKSIYNPTSDQVQFYYGRNLERRMKRRKPEYPPGEQFDYQSANTILLTLVLEKATGMPITEYLETRLWQPLGMEAPGSWSLDRKGKNGIVRTFCCLQAMALDFAKLGRLWLNYGQWEGQQILPADWMNQILHNSPRQAGRYRSGFRIINDDSKTFYTSGLLGQYIYLYPDKNLMILRFGEHQERYTGRMWRKVFSDIYEQS